MSYSCPSGFHHKAPGPVPRQIAYKVNSLLDASGRTCVKQDANAYYAFAVDRREFRRPTPTRSLRALRGFGQAPAQAPPVQCFPVEMADHEGTAYRVLPPKYQSWLKVTFAGWDIVEPPSGPPIPGGLVTVNEPPYSAAEVMAVPLLKKPPDVGNLFRWTERKLEQGQGIIVVPPEGWSECADLMRWPTGQMRVYAGTSSTLLKQHAAPGMPGFVLYQPAGGWTFWSTKPTTQQYKTLAVVVGLGIAAYAVLKYSDKVDKPALDAARRRRRRAA